jgi:hypothetical protein
MAIRLAPEPAIRNFATVPARRSVCMTMASLSWRGGAPPVPKGRTACPARISWACCVTRAGSAIRGWIKTGRVAGGPGEQWHSAAESRRHGRLWSDGSDDLGAGGFGGPRHRRIRGGDGPSGRPEPSDTSHVDMDPRRHRRRGSAWPCDPRLSQLMSAQRWMPAPRTPMMDHPGAPIRRIGHRGGRNYSTSRMVSALLASNPPGASIPRCVTLPSSATSA